MSRACRKLWMLATAPLLLEEWRTGVTISGQLLPRQARRLDSGFPR